MGKRIADLLGRLLDRRSKRGLRLDQMNASRRLDRPHHARPVPVIRSDIDNRRDAHPYLAQATIGEFLVSPMCMLHQTVLGFPTNVIEEATSNSKRNFVENCHEHIILSNYYYT